MLMPMKVAKLLPDFLYAFGGSGLHIVSQIVLIHPVKYNFCCTLGGRYLIISHHK